MLREMPAKQPSLGTEPPSGRGEGGRKKVPSVLGSLHSLHSAPKTILSLHLPPISLSSESSRQQRARVHGSGILDGAQACKSEEKKTASGSEVAGLSILRFQNMAGVMGLPLPTFKHSFIEIRGEGSVDLHLPLH